MARPAPKIFETYFNTMDFYHEEIIDCEGVFVILYNGKPFNYRKTHEYKSFFVKYKHTLFHTRAHADNLCKKLNDKFGNYFTVEEVKFE